jgi:hypothetical protein
MIDIEYDLENIAERFPQMLWWSSWALDEERELVIWSGD